MKLRGCSQFPSARESSGLTDWALLSLINSLNEEKEIEHKEFQLEDFENVETEGAYVTFLKLVKVPE